MTFRLTAFLATAITALFLAPTADAQPRFDGVTLRVATYGGPWKDGMQALIGAEMEKLGGKIEFVTGPPNAHLAKLIVARGKEPPFDLCEVDEPATPQFIKAGVLQKYDVSKLTNASDLISPITHDGYLVPDWVFEDGVVYNADKFKELGITAPKQYRDLLDPRLKGRVGVPDISGGFGLYVVYGFAIDAGGSETNIAAGLENMKKLGATQFFTGNPAAQTALVAGDIWANFMGSSWAIRLRRAGHDWAKFALLKVGDNVGLWERGHMGLAKGSRNVEAAHWFVNRLISPEIQLQLSKLSGSVSVSKKAIAELDKDPVAHEILLLNEKDIDNMRRVDFGKIDLQAWRDEWTRVMLH
jgi:putative spermidine/putrescine transport system substrate-binding protein